MIAGPGGCIVIEGIMNVGDCRGLGGLSVWHPTSTPCSAITIGVVWHSISTPGSANTTGAVWQSEETYITADDLRVIVDGGLRGGETGPMRDILLRLWFADISRGDCGTQSSWRTTLLRGVSNGLMSSMDGSSISSIGGRASTKTHSSKISSRTLSTIGWSSSSSSASLALLDASSIDRFSSAFSEARSSN